jgi:hypothetical protein
MAQKMPGKSSAAMQNAKQEMMNAQAALQQEAQQMQQAASQMQAAASQQMQQAMQPGNPPPQKTLGLSEGNKKEGDTTVRRGAGQSGAGWDAVLSGRDRVKFGQDAERTLPPEYARMVEGYYRRLASEGSK